MEKVIRTFIGSDVKFLEGQVAANCLYLNEDQPLFKTYNSMFTIEFGESWAKAIEDCPLSKGDFAAKMRLTGYTSAFRAKCELMKGEWQKFTAGAAGCIGR